MANRQECAKGGPQRAGELRAPVTGDGVRPTETLNPALEKGSRAVCGGGGGERHSLRPASRTIYNREQIAVTSRLWKRTYQIDMDVCKTPQGNRNPRRLQVNMAVNFAALARDAGASKDGVSRPILGQQ